MAQQQKQKPPQRINAPAPSSSNAATFIFLHGFGDDADGWINIAQQFHAANKLPYLNWVFPNAAFNHEAMANAWYTPSPFSLIPVGTSSTPPDEEDDSTETELLQSVEYLSSLIDEELEKGISLDRIVIGGFSQGCAISLVTGLASRYKEKLAGVVGLSGYLPTGKRIGEGRRGYPKEGEGKMRVFLGHGTRDMLIPMRVFRDAKAKIAKTVGEDLLETHEYEGMGHVASGREFRDMCAFLEKVLPG